MIRGLAFIADPSPRFREGLHRLLRQERFTVCAEGRDVAEAATKLDAAIELALIICTLDSQTCLPTMAQLRELRSQFPASKIIAIADMTLSPAHWREAVNLTDAILSRDISSEVLQLAIDLVLLGQKFLCATPLEMPWLEDTTPSQPPRPILADRWIVAGPILEKTEPGEPYERTITSTARTRPSADGRLTLSDRECKILNCLVRGHSNKIIARELDIAEATVKVRVKGLLRKLRAANRTQAAVWALHHGLALNGTEVFAAE